MIPSALKAQRTGYISYLSFVFSFILFVCVVVLNEAEAQSRPYSPGLQRSYSDPRLNRNSTYQFHRQSSYSHRHHRGDNCKTNYKFDYVQLTLMWAPGSCSTSAQECKRVERNHFTVHGMWPTIKGTQEPSDCCFDNTFDYKALEPLLPTLNEYWFSYYDSHGGNRGFWSHEWLKHGTCSRDIPYLKGEAKYFGTTVQMAKQLPILDALQKANIVPDDQKVYKSSDIVSALSPIIQNKVFQIDCDYEHHQPTPLLTGLNFCFDSNLKPADCPEMKRKCQRQIIFPSSARQTSNYL